MKEELNEEREEKCTKCGDTATHHGMNSGEYECRQCRQTRRDAYDDYVDPLGAYH